MLLLDGTGGARIAAAGAVLVAIGCAACYPTGDSTHEPPQSFYFPVGLAVSRGGNVLYAANADYDLQWSGGTLQSYDLHRIRTDAVRALPNLGAPAVDTGAYIRDSATIGVFATDLQLSRTVAWRADGVLSESPVIDRVGSRLFVPVRGDPSLTWADVALDFPGVAPLANATRATYAPFAIDCGTRVNGQCDAAHRAGDDPHELGNTRGLTIPADPFGMAQSEDATALVVTHQSDTKTSLFATGVDPGTMQGTAPPSLQFVLDGLPSGGNGIVAVPHDPEAYLACATSGPACSLLPRPSFLQTSRSTAELDLLRFYSDQGAAGTSSLDRPFIIKEVAFMLSAGGPDSRGIVIDPSPRIACKARIAPADPSANPPRTTADVAADLVTCARTPARVLFANRAPSALLVGQIGGPSASGDGTYDADELQVFDTVPLADGPSRVYLAPIVDQDGNYSLRAFVVCFDAAQIYVYDPYAAVVEAIIPTGRGPFAMAFDPFAFEDVALRRQVSPDPRDPSLDLKVYRFAYVASFTDSFVQLIDLDDSRADKSTFEKVVFTLGTPKIPPGSQ